MQRFVVEVARVATCGDALGVVGARDREAVAAGAVDANAGAGDLDLRACSRGRRSGERRSRRAPAPRAPESCIFEIELSNGKMLYICSTVTGPGMRSVRMPVVFVSEKSVWMPRRSHIALPTTLPSGESPPVVAKRREPSRA